MAGRFTRRREDFDCLHCGASVKGDGYTNHCPQCLWSRHVDVMPGDRAAACQGMMAPVGALQTGSEKRIAHVCENCGFIRHNRTAPRDDEAELAKLFGRRVPDPTRSTNGSDRHRRA